MDFRRPTATLQSRPSLGEFLLHQKIFLAKPFTLHGYAKSLAWALEWIQWMGMANSAWSESRTSWYPKKNDSPTVLWASRSSLWVLFKWKSHIFYPRERKELSYWWEHRNFMEYLEFWRFFLNRPCTIRYILYSTIRLEWGREWHGIFPFKVICPTAKKTTDRLHHLTFDWTIRSCTETGVYSQQRRLPPKEAHDI